MICFVGVELESRPTKTGIGSIWQHLAAWLFFKGHIWIPRLDRTMWSAMEVLSGGPAHMLF